ncbi:MAG TPA: TIGR00159 family protein [Chloroflexi bacterium]|nr:TIGR00159 family protein [Chloroflexota bacterium]
MEVTNILWNYLLFVFQRANWLSVIDILLVATVVFLVLYLLRDTKALVLLRGVLFLIVIISLLSSLRVLPASSWLVSNTLPTLLLAIPVIFAPEIRRVLERIGRTGSILAHGQYSSEMDRIIQQVVRAARRIAERKYGGLIVFSRLDSLQAYIDTGVILKAEVTPETLIQIFYPKTPLHDGAVILANEVIAAAGCVLPLSASGVLEESPERSMGLRHRAALGIAEETDAVAVVISEETGIVSLAYEGKLDKYVPLDELQAKLAGFFLPEEDHRSLLSRLVTLFQGFVE